MKNAIYTIIQDGEQSQMLPSFELAQDVMLVLFNRIFQNDLIKKCHAIAIKSPKKAFSACLKESNSEVIFFYNLAYSFRFTRKPCLSLLSVRFINI